MRASRVVLERDGALRRLKRQAHGGLLALVVFVAVAAYAASVGSERRHVSPAAPRWEAATAGERATYRDTLSLARATPTRERWTDPVSGHVRLDERTSANVGTPVGGRIARIFVKQGQSVRAGAPLFSIAGPDVPLALADIERAALELGSARIAEKRVSALVHAGALAAKELEGARHRLERARLAHEHTTARFRSWGLAAGKSGELIVKSPRTGTIIVQRALPGQTVDAHQADLMIVADLSTTCVVADLLDSRTPVIAPGTEARVLLAGASGDPLPAKVDAIAPTFDRRTHAAWARIRLDNPAGRLRLNAPVNVQFLTGAAASSVEVPSTAVVAQGTGHYVYLRAGRSFVRREVTVGPTREALTVVTSGLAPGDLVVAEGTPLLDDELALHTR